MLKNISITDFVMKTKLINEMTIKADLLNGKWEILVPLILDFQFLF